MFNFLEFFNSSAFATGASLLNSYAQIRVNRERRQQALYEQRHNLRQGRENVRYDQQQLQERQAEYNAISSYHIDMLRQSQLTNRQQLGYNILKSGIGITATDSAGLLLKHTAYMDEMKARSVEAEMLHHRPKSNLNRQMLNLNEEAIRYNINNIQSSSPWQNLSTVAGGIIDLAGIVS